MTGSKHRIDRSWDEFKDDIDEVLQHNATKCFKNNNENWECTSRLATGVGPHGNMTVVYAYDDSHTPDSRPLGIITAYYKNDSGCFAAKDIETKCP